MLDWRLWPSSSSFQEFNPCHHPAGSSVGGQFCSAEVEAAARTGIGLIDAHGSVRERSLRGEDTYTVDHYEQFGEERPASQRFRYDRGVIVWLDSPTADDYFTVEDHYVRKGWAVKRHEGQTYGNVIHPPKPR